MYLDPMIAFRARMRQRLGLPDNGDAMNQGPSVGPNAATGPYGGGGGSVSPESIGNGGAVGAPNHLIAMKRAHGQGQQMNESIPGPRGTFTTGQRRPMANPMIPWFLRF